MLDVDKIPTEKVTLNMALNNEHNGLRLTGKHLLA